MPHDFVIPQELAEQLVARRGKLHPYEEFTPSRTALLVVDMQNYFVQTGEAAFCPAAAGIVPNINRLADAVRGAGGKVVWIVTEANGEAWENWQNFYEMYSPEGAQRRLDTLIPGSSSFDLWPELTPAPEDNTVIKTRYSAFIQGSSDIESLLRDTDIETVLVTGTVTNVCCESTARDAMMRGFRTIMVSDGNAANTDEAHQAALAGFISTFGDVQTTDQVIDNMKRIRQAAE
ncbi:MAG: cysteine hydrolase [Proteobacteria bacterium]|nr:cysteine hydrolase [Pseudomonadota bacterium]